MGSKQGDVATGDPAKTENTKESSPAGDYPVYCLRGLRSPSWLENGIVKTEAYLPDPRTQQTRGDSWAETSINWEDDDSVCKFTLSKRAQAEHGAARLKRAEIDRITNHTPNCQNKVRYVRSSKPDNPYHGDILFDMNPPKHVHKMIAAALALHSQVISPPNRDPAKAENVSNQISNAQGG